MAKKRLTRRQALGLGLAGMTLPRPTKGGMAMAQNTPDTVVYVSNAGSKEIYVLAMNRDNGELTLIDKVPVPGTDKPSPSSMPMAVTPDRRFLYAALRSDNFPASSFAIDPASGRLTHLGRTPLADQAKRRRSALESGEFAPRFPLRLARKDADLIAEQGLDLRVTDAARSWLHDARADDDDYSAVLLTILERATRR